MNIPESELCRLSPVVQEMFLRWDEFLYSRVTFNRPDSAIHTEGHCERVLLYVLIIGEKIFGDDPRALEILAHAAVFHDTRRQDDSFDTGHGARAAVYYEEFCRENPDITFHPETVFLMRYHDLDDSVGVSAIRKAFGPDADRVVTLYEIFKDADALDRWRLGSKGLDPRFLRTLPARGMTGYSRRIVQETVMASQIEAIEREIKRIIGEQNTGSGK